MGVINLGLLVEKIARKLEGAGFIKSTDYASTSKAGVVKVGDGLAISDAGVLSASGGGGGFSVDTIFSGNDTSGTFTFPAGKSMSDYHFIVLSTDYGTDHDTVSAIVPAPLIVANETAYTNLMFDNTWYAKVTVTPTGFTRSSGGYNINKVYAF